MLPKKIKYAVVFDIDETLGNFSQLAAFWDLIHKYLGMEIDPKYFFAILDQFSLFFRPKLFSLLKRLKQKRQRHICDHVMIYTNNNGPNSWANMIRDYLHYKLRYPLFDQIIRAFEIDGVRIEPARTSHNKSYRDFINCTRMPPNTRVCFLDDREHDEMKHENVVYIKLEPYYYNTGFREMATFFNSKFSEDLFKDKGKKDFIEFIAQNTNRYKLKHLDKSKTEMNIDILVTEQIMKDIDEFFRTPRQFTQKRRIKSRRTTQKN